MIHNRFRFRFPAIRCARTGFDSILRAWRDRPEEAQLRVKPTNPANEPGGADDEALGHLSHDAEAFDAAVVVDRGLLASHDRFGDQCPCRADSPFQAVNHMHTVT